MAVMHLSRPAFLLRPSELVFMPLHIDPCSKKDDSFRFQAETLFHGRLARALDHSLRSYYSVPGQIMGRMQRPNDLPGCPRKSCGPRDGAVTRHFSIRNLADDGVNLSKHWQFL
jgi:hypothetical protein